MGIDVTFYILYSEAQLIVPDAQPVHVLRHGSGVHQVISQVIDITGQDSRCDPPTLTAVPVPRVFGLNVAGEAKPIKVDYRGVPLHYIYVDELAKLNLPKGLRAHDYAMLAYFKQLGKRGRDTPIVPVLS